MTSKGPFQPKASYDSVISEDAPVFSSRLSLYSLRCLSPNILNCTLSLFSLWAANTVLLIARHAIAKDVLIVFRYMYLHNVV